MAALIQSCRITSKFSKLQDDVTLKAIKDVCLFVRGEEPCSQVQSDICECMFKKREE